MTRALGVDLGTRRIGVAVSDSGGLVATPVAVLERTGDRATDHRLVAHMVAEYGAERVVVGLPLSLDGRTGPAAAAVLAEVDELAAALPVAVETIDERFTTVTAHRHLREAGRKPRDVGAVIDRSAATVLLQAWLDRRRARRDWA